MITCIDNLAAGNVNLLQNDYASGLPSPFAPLGLVAALAPSLGVGRWECGVLMVIHRLDASHGRTRAAMHLKEGKFTPAEIPETMTGALQFSLLVETPARIDPDMLRKGVLSARLGGGPIFPRARRTVSVRELVADGSAFRGMDRGYVPVRAREGRRPVSAGRRPDLLAVADELYPEVKNKGTGWIVPLAVGYRLIEDPATAPRRRGVRDPGVPHVFAEPVVGTGELVSVRNPVLTGLDEAGLRGLMWRMSTAPGVIAAHPDYLPSISALQ